MIEAGRREAAAALLWAASSISSRGRKLDGFPQVTGLSLPADDSGPQMRTRAAGPWPT